MRARRFLAGAIFCVLPAFGHHSVAADFDVSRTVRITGTISKVEFVNPHVMFSVDVKNPDGTVIQWKVETAGPNVLIRSGVTKALLAEGTIVVVDAYPAKDGSRKANGRTLMFSGGYKFAMRDSEPYNCDAPDCFRGQAPPVK